MKKCVVVFRSRTQVFSFIDTMKRQGVLVRVVSTPKEAKIGCGISAEISPYEKERAINVIKSENLTSFYGFFMIEKHGNRTTTVRI